MNSITFLTRNYPPSLNINGESVCDMVEYLTDTHKIECNIVYIDKELDSGGKKRTPKGNLIKINNYLDYKFPLFKGIKMLLDGYLLVKKAQKIKNTLYVITSSPPLLPFWFNWLIKANEKRVFWALDLFPESFKAKGIISQNNILYKWIIKKSYSVKPEIIIALGPKQANYIAEKCFKSDNIKTLLLPCGFFEDKLPEKEPEWYEKDKIVIGYCGNIHDAHNPDFVIQMIDNIDYTKHKLILALYGQKSPKVVEYAKNKKGVYLTKSVPRKDLTYIDIHMVSLLPQFTHFAVPSKAVSAITMGKNILFCGDETSDSWKLFKDASWLIKDDNNMNLSIANFCKSITKKDIETKQKEVAKISNELKDMVQDTYKYIGKYALND